MALLLAVAVTMCAICIMVLQARNNQLHHRVEAYKSLHDAAIKEVRKWEERCWKARTDAADLAVDLAKAEEGEALSPPSHDAEHIDIEAVMRESNDPVWDVVIGCRAVGTLNYWVNRHRPDLKEAQRHRIYSEFATYILQLPDHQRNVAGVQLAVGKDA